MRFSVEYFVSDRGYGARREPVWEGHVEGRGQSAFWMSTPRVVGDQIKDGCHQSQSCAATKRFPLTVGFRGFDSLFCKQMQ